MLKYNEKKRGKQNIYRIEHIGNCGVKMQRITYAILYYRMQKYTVLCYHYT